MAPKGEWQPKAGAAEEKGAGKGKKKAEKGGGKGEKAAGKGEKAGGKAGGKGEKASGKAGGKKGGGKGKGKPQDDSESESEVDEVIPQKGKAGKGKSKGKGKEEQKKEGGGKKQNKGKGGDGGDASRSQLNSAAPDFTPAGYGGYSGGMYDEAAMYGWGWQAPVQNEAASLWKEFADADGVPYYYNCKTGLTQWEKPADLEPPKLTPLVPPEMEAKAKLGALLADAKGDKDKSAKKDRRGGGDQPRADRGKDDAGGKGKGGGKKKAQKKNEEDATDFGPPGCNLFVFHLPDDWTDDDLHEYFAPHGSVVSAKVMKELGTGRSRGFGFVSYEDRVSAATAIKKMQGYKILGKRLKVEFKKGEGEDEPMDDQEGGGPGKKNYPDDERLIGYLRAISAKNVVQSLKESEDGAGAEGDAAHAPSNEGAD